MNSSKLKKVRRPADMSLEELYQQEKMTPTIIKNIKLHEEFLEISRGWCERVCTIPERAKLYNYVDLRHGHSDVIVLQDNQQPSEGRKTTGQTNAIYDHIILELCRQSFPEGTTVQVLDLLKCPNRRENLSKITWTMRKHCMEYALAELRMIKPRVIIATSSDCLKALGIKRTLKDSRGHFYLTDVEGLPPTPVIATLHPRILTMIRQNASGGMWGQEYFPLILNDFRKYNGIIRKIYPFPTKRLLDAIIRNQVRVARTLSDVEEFHRILMSLPPKAVISWDTETTSLDPWSSDARILTHQFGYRREDGEIQALVIPMWHRCTPYDPDIAWEMVKEILLNPNPKVGHNLKFDMVFTIVASGVKPNNAIFDTMLMMHSLSSGQKGAFSLKDATWDIIPEIGMGGYEDRLDETLDADDIKRRLKLEKENANREDDELLDEE